MKKFAATKQTLSHIHKIPLESNNETIRHVTETLAL